MGSLTLPTSGFVGVDTAAIIYSIEQIAPYDQLLQPLWQAAHDGTFAIACSELTLLEVLVKPIRDGNTLLEQRYRRFLTATTEIQMLPIDRALLEASTRLRASYNLKTPDAIHAATALSAGCALFVTNDPVFRRVPGLPVVVLEELLTA